MKSQQGISKKGNIMISIQKATFTALSIAMLISLGACNNMSARDKNTAIGATVGGVAGSVLTGGDALGTVGGAVVGGVIGNQVETGRDSGHNSHRR